MSRIYSAGAAIALFAFTASASAYTPKWLQCDGQVVVTGEGAGTKPVHEVYVTDDDARNLFMYSLDRHTLSMEPVKVYSDKEIRWSGDSSAFPAHWEGRIDRTTLGLTLNYSSEETKRTWTEQCKPTAPMEDAGAPAPGATGKKNE